MNDLTVRELRDLLSAIRNDTQGTHGDERADRLNKLEDKIINQIWKQTRGEGN